MDTLRNMAICTKVKPRIPEILKFYRAGLSNMRFYGRVFELGFIMKLKLSTFKLTKDLGLGLKMFLKGKLSIFPRFKSFLAIKKIFSKIKKLEQK